MNSIPLHCSLILFQTAFRPNSGFLLFCFVPSHTSLKMLAPVLKHVKCPATRWSAPTIWFLFCLMANCVIRNYIIVISSPSKAITSFSLSSLVSSLQIFLMIFLVAATKGAGSWRTGQICRYQKS